MKINAEHLDYIKHLAGNIVEQLTKEEELSDQDLKKIDQEVNTILADLKSHKTYFKRLA